MLMTLPKTLTQKGFHLHLQLSPLSLSGWRNNVLWPILVFIISWNLTPEARRGNFLYKWEKSLNYQPIRSFIPRCSRYISLLSAVTPLGEGTWVSVIWPPGRLWVDSWPTKKGMQCLYYSFENQKASYLKATVLLPCDNPQGWRCRTFSFRVVSYFVARHFDRHTQR